MAKSSCTARCHTLIVVVDGKVSSIRTPLNRTVSQPLHIHFIRLRRRSLIVPPPRKMSLHRQTVQYACEIGHFLIGCTWLAHTCNGIYWCVRKAVAMQDT